MQTCSLGFSVWPYFNDSLLWSLRWIHLDFSLFKRQIYSHSHKVTYSNSKRKTWIMCRCRPWPCFLLDRSVTRLFHVDIHMLGQYHHKYSLEIDYWLFQIWHFLHSRLVLFYRAFSKTRQNWQLHANECTVRKNKVQLHFLKWSSV